MKKILKSQHVFSFASALLLTVFMASCGGGAQQKAQESQLKEVKAEVTQELTQLRSTIDERITTIDGELEHADGEVKEQLELGKESLEEQRAKLTEEIEKVEDASVEEWDEVVNDVTLTYREANEEMNTVSKNVREWLERGEEQ
ncbi:MAG: hypothetical protein ACLFS0_08145 [Bacteroidales bacterium]